MYEKTVRDKEIEVSFYLTRRTKQDISFDKCIDLFIDPKICLTDKLCCYTINSTKMYPKKKIGKIKYPNNFLKAISIRLIEFKVEKDFLMKKQIINTRENLFFMRREQYDKNDIYFRENEILNNNLDTENDCNYKNMKKMKNENVLKQVIDCYNTKSKSRSCLNEKKFCKMENIKQIFMLNHKRNFQKADDFYEKNQNFSKSVKNVCLRNDSLDIPTISNSKMTELNIDFNKQEPTNNKIHGKYLNSNSNTVKSSNLNIENRCCDIRYQKKNKALEENIKYEDSDFYKNKFSNMTHTTKKSRKLSFSLSNEFKNKTNDKNKIQSFEITNSKQKKITITGRRLSKILKEAIPSIFNHKYIAKRNLEYNFEKNYEQIYSSACSILGKEEVDALNLHEKIQIYDSESEESFEIIDDEEFISESIEF